MILSYYNELMIICEDFKGIRVLIHSFVLMTIFSYSQFKCVLKQICVDHDRFLH